MMGGHNAGVAGPFKFREKLKEARDEKKSETTGRKDNYMHQCGETTYLEGAHKKKEPCWCSNCDRSATFTRIERDE